MQYKKIKKKKPSILLFTSYIVSPVFGDPYGGEHTEGAGVLQGGPVPN